MGLEEGRCGNENFLDRISILLSVLPLLNSTAINLRQWRPQQHSVVLRNMWKHTQFIAPSLILRLLTRATGFAVLSCPCDECVCLSVCPSARITRKLHGQTLANFLCMLPVAMARSSSDGVAIRMYFQFYGWHVFIPWGQWAESSTMLCLEEFARWQH